MLNDMELQECKESTVPGSKTAEQEDDGELLDRESAKRYRSILMRELPGPGSPRHQVHRKGTLPGDAEPESRKLEEVEDVVQAVESDAKSRAEG